MKQSEDFLVEILTEEIPAKQILKLSNALTAAITEKLSKEQLAFGHVESYATPRRLAVLIRDLAAQQPAKVIVKKGPALAQAYTDNKVPTKATLGFAKSVHSTVDQLIELKTEQGVWLAFQQETPGKNIQELLPAILKDVLLALPISKKMRWGDHPIEFIRPIQSIVMLFGEHIIAGDFFGIAFGRSTRGHRFSAPGFISIPHASMYASILQTEGFVQADFAKRKQKILTEAKACAKGTLVYTEELLDEVTGLVEWPQVLSGNFDKIYLDLPAEVLISAMAYHQRYFAVRAGERLNPQFIFVSNTVGPETATIIRGNERVLRARLADAAFFYAADAKQSLHERLTQLSGMVFQRKLGTLLERARRLELLAGFVAEHLHVDVTTAKRAGLLAKCDLTTHMVSEFPELQGTMGYYYALHDGESADCARAIQEHYLPRFAGDKLPESIYGVILAIAERIDLLTASFGINQQPTGDKDPLGLRRASIGLIRLLIEKNINLDLQQLITFAVQHFGLPLENKNTVDELLVFIEDRLRTYYQEKGVSNDVFAAVQALKLNNLLDVDARIKAVQIFKHLQEAEALSIANKRVSNILTKYKEKLDAKRIDESMFETQAEKDLSQQMEIKYQAIVNLTAERKYEEVLRNLAELRQPIDHFFDTVMVMTEDKPKRENRILLLGKLRSLFLQVADIALLQ